jgi:hypothetical protein
MSATTKLYKFSVWCVTDQKLVLTSGFQEDPPTTCPENVGHTIDPNSVTPIETIAQDVIHITDNIDGVSGHQMAYGYDIPVPSGTPGDTHIIDITSPPFPVRLNTLTINASSDHVGDSLEVLTVPETVVGAITANVDIGDTVINVNSTVVQNLKLGHRVTVDTENLGFCLGIDTVNLTVTVQNAATSAHTTGDAFKLTVVRVHKLYIVNTNKITLASKVKETAFFPTSTPTRIEYTNVNGAAKTLFVLLDLFY